MAAVLMGGDGAHVRAGATDTIRLHAIRCPFGKLRAGDRHG